MELFTFNGTILKSEVLLESAMIHLHEPEVMQRTGFTLAEQKIEAALVELKNARQQINNICKGAQS